MTRVASTVLGRLNEIWRLLVPNSGTAEPTVSELDEWRTEFSWRGPPLVFDRRRKVVLRRDQILASSASIQAVQVAHITDEEDSEYWKVSLSTGTSSRIDIGATHDDVEASIAAARVATVLGVKVLSI